MTEIIIALIGGGGIAGVIGAIFKVTQNANNKAISTLEKAWKEERKENKENSDRLEGKIDNLTEKVSHLLTVSCSVKNCPKRQIEEQAYESNTKKNRKKA